MVDVDFEGFKEKAFKLLRAIEPRKNKGIFCLYCDEESIFKKKDGSNGRTEKLECHGGHSGSKIEDMSTNLVTSVSAGRDVD